MSDLTANQLGNCECGSPLSDDGNIGVNCTNPQCPVEKTLTQAVSAAFRKRREQQTSNEMVPGPKQPPRLHGEGCICGDFARSDCPVKDRKLPSAPASKTLVDKDRLEKSPYRHLTRQPQTLVAMCEDKDAEIERLQEELRRFEAWKYECDRPSQPPSAVYQHGEVVFRDISTAPRDGSTILLRCPKGIVEGAWEQVDGGGHPENGPPIYWWTSPFTEFIDGPYDAPTHWALIPRDAVTKDARPCTCHPDDNPPRPCPQKYALSECRAAAETTERHSPNCSAVAGSVYCDCGEDERLRKLSESEDASR